MVKQSYFEGWGYSDTIKLLIKGTEVNRNLFFKELQNSFPKDEITKVGKDSIEAFVEESKLPVVKKMATIFKMKIAFKGGGQTDDISIAKTILEQLGGQRRLVLMTGAYNFVAIKNGVTFKIKNRKVNYIKIVLNGNDLYDVFFSKIYGGNVKVISEHNDLYFDQLIPMFEKETGMYLKLFKKGGFVSSQNRDMVLSQLKAIHHHEVELRDSVKTSKDIEAWVLAKVQRATTDLSDVTHYLDGKTEYKTGGEIKNDSEINQILKRLESAYLRGTRDLGLIRDKEQIQNPIYRKEMWETYKGFEGELYQWLKKYDIIGENTLIYINNLEALTEWKSKIKQLKSNGYSVITQVSAPSKDKLKRYRYIAIKQKFKTGGEIDIDVDNFSFLSKLSDNALVKRLELIRKQQLINGQQFIDAKNKKYSTAKIEQSGERLAKQERAIIDARLQKNKYKTGGSTTEFIDLFEDYENIPPKVQKILDKYEEDFEDGNYQGLNKANAELLKVGYTFDFYLDGVAYALRPKNLPLSKVKGFIEYARGGGLSLADANPYIAGAKAVQGIAPESVSAFDKKMASRINPDPNRPVFFSIGGKVGDYVQFRGYDDEVRTGTISEELGNDKYSVSSGFGQVLVDSSNYIGKAEKPAERKRIFGIFKEGGEIYKHKHSPNWGEDIKIELIEPTQKGWKVTQTTMKGRSKKTKIAYFSESEIQELFVKI